VDLAAEAGWGLDEEQAFAVDATLSYGPGGRWVTLETAIIEGRQNGKTTGVLQPVVLFDLFLMPASRILWSAHLFKTSRDSFDDFKKAIEATPSLSRRVKRVWEGKGDEEIVLHNGAKLEFLARSSGGGRGLKGVNRVVFDEALFLASAPLDSVIPTLSARPNPQINYGSSAAKATSEHLHKLVKRGRSMADPSLTWVEFCAPGGWANPSCEKGFDCPHHPDMPGCALDNEELWPFANHSIGRTRANGSGVTYEYVRGERRTLSPVGFGRERLGWHEALSSVLGVIDDDLWRSRMDVRSVAAAKVGVGVDASPDLASAAIAMTGTRADGRRHWQVLDHQPGIGWLVGRLEGHRDSGVEFGAVGIDPAGPAGALIPALKAAKFEVVEVTGRAMVQAWGAFLADVKEDRGRHLDQYALNQAIRDAAAPPSGDVAKFSRVKSSGDISPLVAVTISDHMLRTAASDVVQQFFGSWR
jgi:hypothetical protein